VSLYLYSTSLAEQEAVIYQGAGHTFMRDRDPSTNKPEAAKDAQERTTKFFQKNLGKN
jgi:dienelactone hydrolase